MFFWMETNSTQCRHLKCFQVLAMWSYLPFARWHLFRFPPRVNWFDKRELATYLSHSRVQFTWIRFAHLILNHIISLIRALLSDWMVFCVRHICFQWCSIYQCLIGFDGYFTKSFASFDTIMLFSWLVGLREYINWDSFRQSIDVVAI